MMTSTTNKGVVLEPDEETSAGVVSKPKPSESTPLLNLPHVDFRSSWKHLMGGVTVALLWIFLGCCVLVYALEWKPVTALYVITQIVTTVGYGDHHPETQLGKFFFSLYAVVTLILLGTLLVDLMSSIVSSNLERLGTYVAAATQGSGKKIRAPSQWDKAVSGFICFISFVGLGTVWFGLFEACSCSYGIDKVEGCIPGDRCPETGGYVKTWVDCYYLSVLTLTTVGFGDLVPVSLHGRWFMIPWSLIGTITMANFVTAFGDAMTSYFVQPKSIETVCDPVLREMREGQREAMSRLDFYKYVLLATNMVKEDDLRLIDGMYDTLEKDRDGHLSFAEVSQVLRRQR